MIDLQCFVIKGYNAIRGFLNMHYFIQPIELVTHQDWIKNIDEMISLSYNDQAIDKELLIIAGIIGIVIYRLQLVKVKNGQISKCI